MKSEGQKRKKKFEQEKETERKREELIGDPPPNFSSKWSRIIISKEN